MDDSRNRIRPPAPGWLAPLLVYAGAGLATAALLEARRTREAEAAHPPRGRFLDTGVANLHYVDVGNGRPVVLLHGIGATLDDWFISGVADALLPTCRVVALDRPGSGYSSRPGGHRWTPERQADAIAPLMKRLGAEGAVVVGHSYGALPALALALRHPRAVRALVLVAAPYFPGAAIFADVARVPAVPLLSEVARATLTPAAARATAPRFYARFFEPQPVTRRFLRDYPLGLACRPSQLRASAQDADGADAALRRLVPGAAGLDCPIAVVAGTGDALFEPDGHARPFAAAVGAALALVPAGGHMVHHSFPGAVASVIRDAAEGLLPPLRHPAALRPGDDEGLDFAAPAAEDETTEASAADDAGAPAEPQARGSGGGRSAAGSSGTRGAGRAGSEQSGREAPEEAGLHAVEVGRTAADGIEHILEAEHHGTVDRDEDHHDGDHAADGGDHDHVGEDAGGSRDEAGSAATAARAGQRSRSGSRAHAAGAASPKTRSGKGKGKPR